MAQDAGWILFGLALGAFAAVTTGCSALGSDHTGPYDEGYFSMQGDARGLRTFADAMNGLVVTGKASPDKDTAYHYNRRAEDTEITKRAFVERNPAPQGLWQKLWGQPTEQQPPAK